MKRKEEEHGRGEKGMKDEEEGRGIWERREGNEG